ncbi:MAG TPA: DUF4870 domain-containing protein [Gemmataceae bacterium]|nr:DUF4870 domain-containing protein [Gemmataceae bacterium]
MSHEEPVHDAVHEEEPAGLTNEERTWGMLCHLSPLLAYFAAGLTFIGPLVCWLIKKDTSKFVDANGKEALNFQINILVYKIICIALMCIVVGFVLLGVVIVYNIICCVIAGIQANSGRSFRYPFIFRLIK